MYSTAIDMESRLERDFKRFPVDALVNTQIRPTVERTMLDPSLKVERGELTLQLSADLPGTDA